MRIVETLETQHGLLQNVVMEIDRALVEGRLDQVSAQLVRLRAALEAHLELENAEFYPSMLTMAEKQQQPQMLQIVQIFDQNMRVIADGVVKFFDRFAGKPIDRAQFEPQWRSVVGVLARRIEDEESTLHPIHQRLATRHAPAEVRTGPAT